MTSGGQFNRLVSEFASGGSSELTETVREQKPSDTPLLGPWTSQALEAKATTVKLLSNKRVGNAAGTGKLEVSRQRVSDHVREG